MVEILGLLVEDMYEAMGRGDEVGYGVQEKVKRPSGRGKHIRSAEPVENRCSYRAGRFGRPLSLGCAGRTAANRPRPLRLLNSY